MNSHQEENIPKYSSDPKAAAMLIERLKSKGLIDEEKAQALSLLNPDDICWEFLVIEGVGIPDEVA